MMNPSFRKLRIVAPYLSSPMQNWMLTQANTIGPALHKPAAVGHHTQRQAAIRLIQIHPEHIKLNAPKQQGEKEMPAQSLPQTQHQNLGAQVHQHQQQNLRENFPSPEELLCQHDINVQAKHHIVRNHIRPREGAESQPTPRTTTP